MNMTLLFLFVSVSSHCESVRFPHEKYLVSVITSFPIPFVLLCHFYGVAAKPQISCKDNVSIDVC